jgi:hypothetical protein
MRSSSGLSITRRASGWLIVAAGLAGYIGLVLAVPGDRMQPASLLPWWIAQAVPPILYGALTLFCGRRLSAMRWLVLSLLLWTVHIALGFVTQLVTDPSRLFPPPPVPAILWVPLLLFPLRDVFCGGSTAPGARARSANLRVTPVASARPGAVTPIKVTATVIGTRETSSPPRETVAAPVQVVEQPKPARPAPSVAPSEALPASRPAPSRSSAAARPPAAPAHAETSGSEASGEMVRVSFSRIAEQLPVTSFKLTSDRIAASLREPGFLLVPQQFVRAQLLEGVVRVRWDVVSEQFPRQLGLTDAEIAGRLSDGQLVLPLDEIFAQLPRDLFVLTNPPLDLTGIENFPAPFQPLSADQPEEGAADHETAPVGATVPVAEAGHRDEVESILSPASLPEQDLEIEAESPAQYELTDLDLDQPIEQPVEQPVEQPLEQPVATIPAAASLAELDSEVEAEFPERYLDLEQPVEPPLEAEAALTASVEPEPSPSPAIELESIALEPDQVVEAESEWSAMPFIASAVAGPTDRPTAAPVEDAAHADGRSRLEIMSLLAAVGLFHLAVDSTDDQSLVLVAAPGLPSPDRLAAAARLMLPFLAHGPAGARPELLTLRGRDVTLVLASLDSGDVLVAAAPPMRSLAMLEILCRRAALGHGGVLGATAEDDDPRDEPDLVELELSTRIHVIAQSLSAVGPVIASTLRDLETEWPVYCFLPPDSDVRATAAYACEVSRAMSAAGDEPGIILHTAVLASGRSRLIIRVSTNPFRGGIFVASGETDRPGLAYRQAASAADTLLVG